MKKMPSFFLIVLTTVMVFTAYCGSGADKKPEQKGEVIGATVTIDSVISRAGDSLDVAIRLENSQAIGGMQLRIRYDVGKLTCGKPKTTKRSTDMMVMHNPKDNELLLMMYNISGKTISPGNGPVLMLPVRVADGAAGVYSLEIREAIVATHDAQSVPTKAKSGAVNVRRR